MFRIFLTSEILCSWFLWFLTTGVKIINHWNDSAKCSSTAPTIIIIATWRQKVTQGIGTHPSCETVWRYRLSSEIVTNSNHIQGWDFRKCHYLKSHSNHHQQNHPYLSATTCPMYKKTEPDNLVSLWWSVHVLKSRESFQQFQYCHFKLVRKENMQKCAEGGAFPW